MFLVLISSTRVSSPPKWKFRQSNVDFMLSSNRIESSRRQFCCWRLHLHGLFMINISCMVTWGMWPFNLPLPIFIIWCSWRNQWTITVSRVLVKQVHWRHAMSWSSWSAWEWCVRSWLLVVFDMLFSSVMPVLQCCCHIIFENGWFHGRTHLYNATKEQNDISTYLPLYW